MSCLREWLSGGAPPCQGGGRGFDPRLALLLIKKDIRLDILFYYLEVRCTSRTHAALQQGFDFSGR